MSRAKTTVKELADECGKSWEEMALILGEIGIDVEFLKDVIPRSKLNLARGTLRLPRGKYQRELRLVAKKIGLEPHEALDILKADEAKAQRDHLSSNDLRKLKKYIGERNKKAAAARRVVSAPPPGAEKIEEMAKPEKRRHSKPDKTARDLAWRIIGTAEEMNLLEPRHVEAIHYRLVEDFAKSRDPIFPPGVKSAAMLESAVYRQRTSLDASMKYPSISMAGAALLHAIIHDHPFHNGNKRTALVSLLVFLDRNSYILTCDQDELYEFVLRVSAHQLLEGSTSKANGSATDCESIVIASWVQNRIRRIKKHERSLKWRELKQILGGYGCNFEIQTGNKINIFREDLHTQVAYAGEGRDADSNTIHKVRRDLLLDEEHGCDSEDFYNKGGKLDEFINEYRKILDRLAKD